MSDLRVTSEALGATATTLATIHGELALQLDRLQSDANALAGRWAGAAQEAFRARYGGWSVEAAHLSGVLEDASRAAAAIAEDYRAADERVGAIWSL